MWMFNFRSVVLLGAIAFLAPADAIAQPRVGPGVRRANKAKADKMERRQLEFERLERMSPEDRRRALDRLPAERRERVEQGLERYRRLNSNDRERFLEFRRLPSERREAMRANLRQMQSLEPKRRMAVRDEIQTLRDMNPDERQAHLNSETFRKRFDQREQDLLADISRILPD